MNHTTTRVSGKALQSSFLLCLLMAMVYPSRSAFSQTPATKELTRKYRIDYLPELNHLMHGTKLVTALLLDNSGNLLLIQGQEQAKIANYQAALRAYIARQQRMDQSSNEPPPVRPIVAESVLWMYRPASQNNGHGCLIRLGTIPGECQATPAANHASEQLAIRWTPPPLVSSQTTPQTHAARLDLPPRVSTPQVVDLGSGIVIGMDGKGDMVGGNDTPQPCLYPAGSTTPVLLPLPEDVTRGFANAISGDRIAGYIMRSVVVTQGRNTFHNTARLPVVWHLSAGADRTISTSWNIELLPTAPNAETPVVGINDIGSDGTVVGWVIPAKAHRQEPCLWKPTATGYRLQMLTPPVNYRHQQGIAMQINDLGQVLIYTTNQKTPFTDEAPAASPQRIPYEHLWQNGTFLKIPVEGLYAINGEGQMLVALQDRRHGKPVGTARFAILTQRK